MDDPRKTKIWHLTCAFFGIDADKSSLPTSSDLDRFLDDVSCSVLQGRLSKDGSVEFSNDISIGKNANTKGDDVKSESGKPGSESQKSLFMVKKRQIRVSDDNFSDEIAITSVGGSAVHSLFDILRSVFSPALLSGDTTHLEPSLEKALGDLQAGLGALVRREEGGKPNMSAAAGSDNSTAAGYSGIISVENEFQYWSELPYHPGVSEDERDASEKFVNDLQEARDGFASLYNKDLKDVPELLEKVEITLVDLWSEEHYQKFYPQERMVHLFGIITSELLGYVQNRMKFSPWNEKMEKVRSTLEAVAQLCIKWANIMSKQTKYWVDMWKGPPHHDELLEKFAKRMEEVLALRAGHEQLKDILPDHTDVLERAFAGTRPLLYNPYTEPRWNAAVSEYEKLMKPVEQRIASELGQKLRDSGGNALTMLREFNRYGVLVRRKAIREGLSQERDLLLGQLLVYVQSLIDEYDSRSASIGQGGGGGGGLDVDAQPRGGRDLPEVVRAIVWSRQVTDKLSHVVTASSTSDLLSDLNRYSDLVAQCDELKRNLKSFENNCFDDWQAQIEEGLSDQSLSLQMTGRLMELDYERGGKLTVNFSPRMIGVLREVRQLTAMSFKVPSDIVELARTAEKFSRHGIVLKQVANFYNTIDKQMIPSTKPALIDLAIQFEQVIKNPTGSSSSSKSKGNNAMVTWKDPSQLEAYIGKIQHAADVLTDANRRLIRVHKNLSERVVQLMNTDLLRQQSKWKEILQSLRGVFASLERQGFKNLAPWKRHWDAQLYKALEHQYQIGLESLHEMLPEIKVDLVFKQQQLQFRPPIEEIRARYYRELKKFVNIPSHFPGVGDSPFFKEMLERNTDRLVVVYQKAEVLFTRLVAEKDKLIPWVILGTVDLNAFVEDNVKEVEDWELNFRAIKTRGRDVDKIPAEIQVDCIKVSTGPLRASIDDQFQSLADCLVSALRTALKADILQVEQYIQSSLEKLQERPQTVEEIGLANQAAKEINLTKANIQSTFKSIEEKNKLLRFIVGEGMDIATLTSKWSHLESTLTSHETIIREQADVLKRGIEQNVNEYLNDVGKFAARWKELKPKEIKGQSGEAARKAAQAALESIKERRAEFDELESRAASLIQDCHHFDLPNPDLAEKDEVMNDLESTEHMWALFEEYSAEVQALTGQDWISFRHRLYEFDDLRIAWERKVRDRSRKSDSVSLYIARELDEFKKVAPLLKWVKGESMTDNHWRQLYNLIGLDKKLKLEDLTMNHFLSVGNALIKKEDKLKELHARAAGEVAIREALQEVEMWGQDTQFVLVDHTEQGRTVKLITEWKDLITQVGDNQSLLASLKDSPFFEPFADEANGWENRLGQLDEYLHSMVQIQRRWVYLEPIFGRGALPQEQSRFKRLDSNFVDIMAQIEDDARVVSLCQISGLLDTLNTLLEQLERCQKALAAFLEEKRSKFPRFYFIGDDDLLEILGQARNPAVIQNHLKKLFQGVHTVGFQGDGGGEGDGTAKGNPVIISIKSAVGEVVPLKRSVATSEDVETWLAALAQEMVGTLSELLVECVEQQPMDLDGFPSQILCLAAQIIWVSQVERALNQRNLVPLQSSLKERLSQYTSLDTSGNKLLSLKVKALVMDLIHHIEVVDLLAESGERLETGMWLWQKQLRFYLNAKKKCIAMMCDATQYYTYEYQGNSGKLVHTPLTDKCYLTLTQGIDMGFGGNPYGPAGTGKTESVKALGNAMGRQVLVFNCFAPHTLLRRADGRNVAAKDVSLGMKLLGDDGQARTVVNKFGGQAQLFRIKEIDNDNGGFLATANHKLLVVLSASELVRKRLVVRNQKQQWVVSYVAFQKDKKFGMGMEIPYKAEKVFKVQENDFRSKEAADNAATEFYEAQRSNDVTWEVTVEQLMRFMDSDHSNFNFDRHIQMKRIAVPLWPQQSTHIMDIFEESCHDVGVNVAWEPREVGWMVGYWLGSGDGYDCDCEAKDQFLTDKIKYLKNLCGDDVFSELLRRIGVYSANKKEVSSDVIEMMVGESQEFRLGLFEGLIDSDGGLHLNDNSFVLWQSVNDNDNDNGGSICRMFRDVARSLGFVANHSIVKDRGHQVRVRGPLSLLKLVEPVIVHKRPREHEEHDGHSHSHDLYRFSIEPEGPETAEYVGFTVDGNHRIVLDDFSVTFNCDEGIDFKSMGRIFTGLCKCGAWGCFDEFNRLDEEVLSAVSQQIQVIQSALKNKEDTLELLGSTINVDSNAGIFVTMNPAGKGYGGRSKLPDNLKQLFRPVSMTIPDNDLISEVILYSEGFGFAKSVGHKLVSVFNLAKQMLSPQQHYDWGLRALKTILQIGGSLVQNERAKGPVSEEVENELVVKAARVNTLSKLTAADVVRFNALLRDVFPGTIVGDVDYEQVREAIEKTLAEMKLEVIPSQINKILQLYENLRQRMGVVIVGPSGSGKSTLWRVLRSALSKVGQKVMQHIVNPKSIEREKLLGNMDLDTREWTDGVLTQCARLAVKEPLETTTWITLDGDIDPEWVESLNSVLDDNRLLTMPSGERIKFSTNVNFLFETHSLKFASPATVSRMGMIFLSDKDMTPNVLVDSWLQKQPEEDQRLLSDLIDDYFYRALEWFEKFENVMVVETTKLGLVQAGLSHLTGVKTKAEFILGIARSLGSNMTIENRNAFCNDLFGWANVKMLDSDHPLNCYYDQNKQRIRKLVDEVSDPLNYDDLNARPLINTTDVQRDMLFFKPWLDAGEPFIVAGPEGAGKKLILTHAFQSMKGTSVAVVHCSAETNATQVISKLLSVCNLRSTNMGRVLQPREGDRLILFLQDINLPTPDKYATVELVELLRQLASYKGFFDDNLEWIGLERVQIVACMNPAESVGRHALSTRFTSICRSVFVTYPEREKLELIFQSFVDAALTHRFPTHKHFSRPEKRNKLVSTMVKILLNMRSKFPEDEQAHYLFTPRDLVDWVLQLLRYDLDSESIGVVLSHSACRLFRDRLVGSQHLKRFDSMLSSVLKSDWSSSSSGDDESHYFSTFIYQNQTEAEGESVSESEKSPFGMTRLGRLPAENFVQIVKDSLLTYERENKELNIQLFPEILEHITNLDVSLSVPGGSLMLIGRSGVGRKTATTLVAHMHHMQMYTPNMTRNYERKHFRADLKLAMQSAAVEGEGTVFYFEDHNSVEQSFLEDINALLSSGEVPSLYTPDEIDALMSGFKEQMQSEDFRGTTGQYFVSRVKRNLHIVLAMDPTSDQFLPRCQRNPALYVHCTIQWLGEWSSSSLKQVTRLILKEEFGPRENAKEESDIVELVNQMVKIHSSMISRTGVSPRDYVSFLHTFHELLDWKSRTMTEQTSHLTAGLAKLEEAKETVDELNREAEIQRVQLGEKQKLADDAMEKITVALQEATEQKQEMEKLQVVLADEKEKMSKRKSEIDAKLENVEPLLEQARKLVGNINTSDLNEIKSLRTPPPAVHDVLEGVLRLMGQKDTSWNAMKNFLKQTGVVTSIVTFDAMGISKKIRDAVEKLLKEKAQSFDPKVIRRASVAAAPLAEWVKANIEYSAVVLNIAPLMADQKRLGASLAASEDKVKKLQENLQIIDENVRTLKSEFAQRTGEAEQLKIKLEKAEATTARASSLLGKLDGERKRWHQTVSETHAQLAVLPKHSLLAAAFVSYLANEPEDEREHCMKDWSADLGPDSEGFNVQRFTTSESELLEWKAAGLPADELSVENAIVIMKSDKTPLIIDPTMQCVSWLKSKVKSSMGLEVTNPMEPRFQNTLEIAVRFGKTLIILEADQLEPMLYPLLRRDLARTGLRLSVQIGEKTIEYSETFKLFLVTRNPHPSISPDGAALVNRVNFTVTRSGLEGRLLGVTLLNERPELEQQKSELLKREEEQKIQLAKLEKELLHELATSEGNILENQALIESLNLAKQKSQTISESLAESKQLQANLDQEREVYRPIANYGSTLFFLIKTLQHIDHVYQFSLGLFLRLFEATFENATKHKDVSERIKSVSSYLLRSVFSYMSRSLFKRDRLMLAAHVSHGVRSDMYGANEWELFLGQVAASTGSAAGGRGDDHDDSRSSRNKKGMPDWIAADRHDAITALKSTLPAIYQNLNLTDRELWQQWILSSSPEINWPEDIGSRLSTFQRVLVIQALRPDRLSSAIQNFACQALSISNVNPPPTNFERIQREETTNTEPILILVTPGADPTTELQELAKKTIGQAHFHQVAMGQGQADIAMKLLRECAASGDWLCLKNLHLVTSWLPTLEKEFNSLTPHDSFRLWLTSEPHTKLPAVLLQHALKITFEAPPGVKKNLQRTYDSWGPDVVEKTQSPQRAQGLFVLAWLHAVIQERRTYVPQGWSKFYEFSEADLRAAVIVMDKLLTSSVKAKKEIQWDYMHGLMENAIYGGRVDNEYDVLVLRTYLAKYLNSDVLPRPPNQSVHRIGGKLTLPDKASYKTYMDVINSLPEQDPPSFFGLPANIDRTVQQATSALVISQLKTLSFGAMGDDLRFDRDLWRTRLSPILLVWNRLMAGKPLLPEKEKEIKPSRSTLRRKSTVLGITADSSLPVQTFVDMEVSNAQLLCETVNYALEEVSSIIDGKSLLTAQASAIATSLLSGEVPIKWSDRWEGPEDPYEWLREIASRTVACVEWKKKMLNGTLFKEPVNLGDLFRPATFLSSLRQQTARLTNQAMNNLCLQNTWDETKLRDHELVVTVRGLLLQGAGFDTGKLSPATAEMSAFNSVLPVRLAYVPIDSPSPHSGASVRVPLYETGARESLVAELSMPIPTSDQASWILSSVALFLRGI